MSPLGSGALAGTTLPLDREATAKALGLAGVTQNSLDAVSDRDSAIELLFAVALAAVHLSRVGEEIVLWTTQEFGFMRSPTPSRPARRSCRRRRTPTWASSPAGRAGRAIGDLVALLAIVKSLPLSYNRDLQEDKRPLLGGPDALVLTADAVAGAIETATFHADRMEAALGSGEALAHRRGRVPRRARRAVPRGARGGRQGGRVLATARGARSRAHRRGVAALPPDVREGRAALLRRAPEPRAARAPGAPGPRQVARQLARWEKALAKERR